MRVAAALLGLAIASQALADGTAEEQTAVKLYRGTSVIAASDPSHATYRPNFTREACLELKTERWRAEAATKTEGTRVTYKCQMEERSIITFHPPPTCAPPRAPQTRTQACPGGNGTFQQTQTWTIAPHPTCEIAGAWLPATPSPTDCPPLELAAPTGLTATAISTSVIRLRWNVVPDALAYSIRRCIGGCDPMSRTALICVPELTKDHVTLPANTTVSYQVQASRRGDCSGELSAPSVPIVSATTLSAPTIPTACSSLVCNVTWLLPSGPTPEGYRIYYSRTNGTWASAPVQVNDATATSVQITMPGTGTWYFVARSFIGANESDLSNVLVRDVR